MSKGTATENKRGVSHNLRISYGKSDERCDLASRGPLVPVGTVSGVPLATASVMLLYITALNAFSTSLLPRAVPPSWVLMLLIKIYFSSPDYTFLEGYFIQSYCCL